MEENNVFILNNRYLLTEQIGEGGMANVYLANDQYLDRKVAVKILRGDLSNDETFVKRFQREALAATTLEHPNLVQIYDVGEESGYHFIVMEYVEGKTLKQLIKQFGPLSVNEVIDVMEQLISAVEHAHSRQVIHRDIKPQNIIVRSDGTIKLTDFGIAIAQNASQLTQTNNIMGSVHYLAPELAKGHLATVQSDIYSLGIVMFELLTGTVPFSGDSAVNIALMHMEDEMPSVRDICGSDLSQAVENIIIKSTLKNRKFRYQSAHEMLLDVSSCNAEYRRNEPVFVPQDDQSSIHSTIVVNKNDINKNDESDNKKKIIIIVSALSAVLVAILLFFFILKPAETFTMPKLIGTEKEEALKMLDELGINEEAGFNIEIVSIESDEKEGTVLKTEPKFETEFTLKNQTNIKLEVSTPLMIKFPDVVGLYESEAKPRLTELGFIVRTNYVSTSSHPSGSVFETSLKSGESYPSGTEVRLDIAIEPKITMINVVGFSFINATDRLSELSLIARGTNCTESAIVESQSVAVGNTVEKNAIVELTCEIPVEKEDPLPELPPENEDATPVDTNE